MPLQPEHRKVQSCCKGRSLLPCTMQDKNGYKCPCCCCRVITNTVSSPDETECHNRVCCDHDQVQDVQLNCWAWFPLADVAAIRQRCRGLPSYCQRKFAPEFICTSTDRQGKMHGSQVAKVRMYIIDLVLHSECFTVWCVY